MMLRATRIARCAELEQLRNRAAKLDPLNQPNPHNVNTIHPNPILTESSFSASKLLNPFVVAGVAGWVAALTLSSTRNSQRREIASLKSEKEKLELRVAVLEAAVRSKMEKDGEANVRRRL